MTSKHKTINKMQYAKFRNKHNLEKYTKEGLKFMIIEDMQQSLELLENIKYFFYNIEEIEKKLNIDLRNKEYERDDLLHEIELSKLNAIEIMAVYKKLEKVLQERRIIKDKIDLVSTIKPYTSKFITKGICAETDTTIKNIETLKRNQENRQYTPRVLQDLKCAKKKKGE